MINIDTTASFFVGLFSGFGTTSSFLPQVIHIYKTNSISGLSPYLLFIHICGTTGWILYGFLRKDMIIISFNIISFTLLSLIICKYVQIYYLNSISRMIEISSIV